MKTESWRIIELLEDVKNPEHVDRRVKDDWRKQAVWPAGMRFVIEAGLGPKYDEPELAEKFGALRCTVLRYYNDRWPSLHELVDYSKTAEELPKGAQVSAILAAKHVEIPQDYRGWYIINHEHKDVHAPDLIQHMLNRGLLTLEGIARMTEEMRAEEEASE